MLKTFWKLIQFLPPDILTFIKHKTSAQLRYFIRQNFGADYRNIPDSIISVSDGRKFHIGPDMVYWGLYYGLGYEPEVTSLLGKFVRPGDIVFDIGANFGWYSTMFAQKLGTASKVYAFEPVPPTFGRLNEHIKLNHLENLIIPNRIALSDRVGQAKMHLFKGRSHALASLDPQGESDYEIFEAPLVTLDIFLEENQLTHIDFAKIDVEGNELMVLKGASKILSSSNAPILMVEINNDTFASFNYNAEQIWNCLKMFGYDTFYGMLNGNALAPIKNITDFTDIANVVMLRSKHEQTFNDVPLTASFKAVPGMVICGKLQVIEPRIKVANIKVIDRFLN
jgi:FkbM family methyltransferase